MRRSPIQRHTPLPRASKPMRARKRSASEFQRIYGGAERVAWQKAQPCLVIGCGRGPCEVVHTTSGGTGRKADACHTVSLCAAHHRELHAVGVRTFESLHHLSLAACAAECERAWREVAA
jgi:hypothetical protein